MKILILFGAGLCTLLGMREFSNIVDMTEPLLILLSILVLGIFIMLFSNFYEIFHKRNLKLNILSSITALDGLIVLASHIMLSYKTIELTESQNNLLFYVTIVSTISFLIMGNVCTQNR